MADKKPLRLSDDANDLQTKEFDPADTIGIDDGGTSATVANDALNNLLPTQTGNGGKNLQTDGANTSWQTPAQGGHEIQEETVAVPLQPALNFGPGFDVADNPGNSSSDVTLDLSEVLSDGGCAALKYAGPGLSIDLDPDVWKKITTWNDKIDTGGTVIVADAGTDDITVGVDGEGKYDLNYSLTFTSNTSGELESAIYKNGSRVEPSRTSVNASNGQKNSLSGTCLIEMLSTDYLELWIKSDATNQDPDIEFGALVASKCSGGAKGEKGDPGAGSTIGVKDEGSAVAGAPHDTLDFAGAGVEATDGTLGRALITIPGSSGSNVGTAGVGLFKQKVLNDLEFKKLNAGSTKVSITDDVANNEVDVDVNEANLTHDNMGGTGTNTHAQIDSHVASVANPHSVTKTQVGLSNVPNTDATARANHTGTQLASTISDFDTEVSNNTSVAANTAKVSNATHTSEVTGATALAVQPLAISNKTLKSTLAGTEEVLINDTTLKKTTTQDIADLVAAGGVTDLSYSWRDVTNSSTSYAVVARFIFDGSTKLGTPSLIEILIDIQSSSADIKIFDATNSLTIAELNGATSTGFELKDLGTLSNIPTGLANFEIQMKKSGGGTNQLAALSVEF